MQEILDKIVAALTGELDFGAFQLPLWGLLVAIVGVILVLVIVLLIVSKKRVSRGETNSAKDIVKDVQTHRDMHPNAEEFPLPVPTVIDQVPAPSEFDETQLPTQTIAKPSEATPMQDEQPKQVEEKQVEEQPQAVESESPEEAVSEQAEPAESEAEPQAEPVAETQEAQPAAEEETSAPVADEPVSEEVQEQTAAPAEEATEPVAEEPAQPQEIAEEPATQKVAEEPAQEEIAASVTPQETPAQPARKRPQVQRGPMQVIRIASTYEEQVDIAPTDEAAVEANANAPIAPVASKTSQATIIKLFGEKTEPTKGKYLVYEDLATPIRPYRFTLLASNGQIMFTSEAYKIRPRARQIETFRKAVHNGTFTYDEIADGSYRFRLYTPEGKLYGTGEPHTTLEGAESAAMSVTSLCDEVNFIEDPTVIPE